ncbi:serine/threonine protein kinase [Bifidobacterium jacchi]|uniref:non-specific serine/threonine protein kinase n=2 Tax=Bifidobacterium jacchi TaxID=2490545 RepID=A0A5N5RMF4_9BIFI|nr:serine/threonine protein kinase [Bifidobacterium jacchi]
MVVQCGAYYEARSTRQGKRMVTENTVVGKRYKILTQIGKGGMSTVYLALDTTLNKQWAIKEIKNSSDPVQRDLVIKSMQTEASMIKSFDHPAIPRIVDLVQEKGSLFVVMDYVEGRTLSSLLKKEGPQPEDEVVDWGVQLCDVLEYLHQRKPAVIFRDMKPSNVMLTPEGMVKLIDFGIAIQQGGADKPLVGDDRQLGTPGFGAPEQFEEHPKVDARTDVYALGATLFYLLTGSHPRKTGIVPIRQINPDLSEGLERIIARATRKNPAERYADCAEMAYALTHYREEDVAHRKALVGKWWTFLGTAIAAAVCLVASGALALGANSAQNNDFNYWIQQAKQTSDAQKSADNYLKAIEVKPDSAEPYEGLIDLYTSDGTFSTAEEKVYNNAIVSNSAELQKNKDDFAQLSFDTGKLYWYYYDGGQDSADSAADAESQDPARYARMRAASQWMHNAADDSSFKDVKLAQMYADIADFNMQIVPLINEGSDQGLYKPYFAKLQSLVETAGQENNDVMRLESSGLVLDALRVYPRKFRADGISQAEMEQLAEQAGQLSDSVTPTTTALDTRKEQATEALKPAQEAIKNAFVDIKGEAK